MDTTLDILDVKEREISDVQPPSFPSAPSASGFPAHKKRVSAFKQQRQAKSNTASPAPNTRDKSQKAPADTPADTPAESSSHNGAPSQTKTNYDERRAIDEENRALIDSMSPEEIAEAQKELFAGLDPKLIQMLLRRSTLDEPTGPSPFDVVPPSTSANPPPSEPPHPTVEDAPAEPAEPAEPETSSSVPKANLTKPKKTVTFDEDAAPPAPPPDLFPARSPPSNKPDAASDDHPPNTHFPHPPAVADLDPADPDFLETMHKKYFPNLPADPSKLAWMAPIPTEDSPADRESPYYPGQRSLAVSALRFDFRGALVPPRLSRAIPVTKGLHHHGEAPEAAGYTIPELARLARSAVPAQRCIAYQTLGRILYRLGRGDWGGGAGGKQDGEGDDLAFALWRCVKEGRVLESLEEEAGQPEGRGHLSSKAYATEALWLFEKGGWKERWRGL